MRIAFVTRSLEVGGAERQLVELACGLHDRGHEVSVKAFYGGGVFEQHLEERGIPVRVLNKRGRWDVAHFMLQLLRELRRDDPDIVHGYLPVPNLLLAALKPMLKAKVVWGIRASDMQRVPQERISTLVYDLEARVANVADLIIVNSYAGFASAQARGIRAAKMVVVQNGIDIRTYKEDPEARARVRAELGLAPTAIAIGIVARLDPIKDHRSFLRAAAAVSQQRSDVRFVIVGGGPDAYRRDLGVLERELGLENVSWAGSRPDMPAVYNALDIGCLCSLSEGFPNTIGEAMACGRPCVVTDAGDAARLVGETGIVVPTGDSMALARALLRMVDDPARNALGERARERIVRHFSPAALCERTSSILTRLLQMSS